MSWVRHRADLVLHACVIPHPFDQGIALGDIWRCDECGLKWERVVCDWEPRKWWGKRNTRARWVRGLASFKQLEGTEL